MTAVDWLLHQVPDAEHAMMYGAAGLPAVASFFYRLRKVPGSRLKGNIASAARVYSAIFTFSMTAYFLATDHVAFPLNVADKLGFGFTALVVAITSATEGLRGTPVGDRIRLLITRHVQEAEYVSPSHPLLPPLQELENIHDALRLAVGDATATAVAKGRLAREDAAVRAVLMRLRDRKAIESNVCTAIEQASEACRLWLNDCSSKARGPDCVLVYCGLIRGAVAYIPELSLSA